MLQFEPFASGSGGNLYRVTATGHAPLLIEAGVAYRVLQRRVGFIMSSFAGALVSHAHGDHSVAVPALLAQAVPVYASAATAEALGVAEHHNLHVLEAGAQVQVGEWSVLPFDLVHDVPCLGFLVASRAGAGEKLLYISDTAYCEYRFENVAIAAVEANYSRGILDHLVERGSVTAYHAARVIRNHLSLEHAAQLLSGLTGPALREVHLLHLSGGNSSEDDFRRQIERIVGVPVHVAPEGVRA